MTTPAKKEGKIGDKERLDWLELQHVQVRIPLLHGSREAFAAYADNSDEESEIRPSNLRAAIDAAIRAERKGKL